MDGLLDDSLSHAPISPALIKWARERAGLTLEQLSHNFVPVEKLAAWESEPQEALPTLAQAETLASKLKIPLPVLFLSDPPDERIQVVDFRTLSGRKRKHSAEFLDTVNDAIVRQNWYSEYIRQEYRNRPLSFVGSFTASARDEDVARDIREKLRIDAAFREESQGWKDFLSKLIQRAEQRGILVMRNAIVGYEHTRKLRIEEFRGFALTDPYAPLIFINYRDAKAAQIFTFAHELAHVWLGASGISNPDPTKPLVDFKVALEQKCNAIAAEVLVPAAGFSWDERKTTEANVQQVAQAYRVSRIVALRRANDLERVTKEEFKRVAKKEYSRSKRAEAAELRREESKGHFWNWNLFLMRNGHSFTKEVATAAKAGRLSFVRAAHLLGVSASTVDSYLNKFHLA